MFGQGEERLGITRIDGHYVVISPDPGIAWGADNLIHAWVTREPPAERVLAGAGAHDKDSHLNT